MSKYKNVRKECGGHIFDSKKEAARYGELLLLQRVGMISDIELQPKFPLVVNGVKVALYISDFKYLTKEGKTVVEDVKSVATKTAVYRLKNKLFHALYRDLRITEIF